MQGVKSALGLGLAGFALFAVSCSGGSEAGQAGPKAAPSAPVSSRPAFTVPSAPGSTGDAEPGKPPPCTALLKEQEVRSATKTELRADSLTNKPPKRCGYSGGGAGMVSFGYLPTFPIGQGTATRLDGEAALIGDDSKTQPPKCSVYVDLDATTLYVNVAGIKADDLCSVTRSLAETALSRVPRS